jgi:hypothetical protein
MTHRGTHEEGVTSGGLRNVRHFGAETGAVEIAPRPCPAPSLPLSGDGCLWIGQKKNDSVEVRSEELFEFLEDVNPVLFATQRLIGEGKFYIAISHDIR